MRERDNDRVSLRARECVMACMRLFFSCEICMAHAGKEAGRWSSSIDTCTDRMGMSRYYGVVFNNRASNFSIDLCSSVSVRLCIEMHDEAAPIYLRFPTRDSGEWFSLEIIHFDRQISHYFNLIIFFWHFFKTFIRDFCFIVFTHFGKLNIDAGTARHQNHLPWGLGIQKWDNPLAQFDPRGKKAFA